MAVASCNELTNETLLRSILFGHRRGAFTDAREDRPGLVSAAGRGVLLLDDFHRLPASCSAILHSFLEDGEYSRLGEEEIRRAAEAAAVLTVETGPWLERRRSGELPLAFLARVERLPADGHAPAGEARGHRRAGRWLARTVSAELGTRVELDPEAVEGLQLQPFAESNSRELRNVIERAIYRFGREVDTLDWSHPPPVHGRPRPDSFHSDRVDDDPRGPALTADGVGAAGCGPWPRRSSPRGTGCDPAEADALAADLFDRTLGPAWTPIEASRAPRGDSGTSIPLPVWEDVWRCYAVSRLGGPSPAERVLGIPANTLRQWINDRESR